MAAAAAGIMWHIYSMKMVGKEAFFGENLIKN